LSEGFSKKVWVLKQHQLAKGRAVIRMEQAGGTAVGNVPFLGRESLSPYLLPEE
jgi:hypothetical protein